MKLILFVVLVFYKSVVHSETINVLTYHDHPVFVTSDGEGLTYEAVDLLNSLSEKHRFNVHILPRKRLDLSIQQPGAWVVAWVNPSWFGDKEEKRFLWVNAFEGQNRIISLAENKIDYHGPESLEGMVFGGILGHRYLGIDDLVEQGRIKRIDTFHELENIKRLLYGRIDITLLPHSTIHYLIKKMSLENKLYIAPQPQQVYIRKFMVSPDRADIRDFIADTLTMHASEWKKLADKYSLQMKINKE